MKKFLFRGARLPWCNPTHYEYILNDMAWTNIGNMLFSDAMVKTIMTDMNDEFILVGTNNSFDPKKATEINEKCDYFVMPYANAFRPSFNLSGVTKLIQALKIPCVVTGIGFQGEYEPNFSQIYPFDEDVKMFCMAVLEKSSSIGVRGEITYHYLVKHLGLPSDKIDIIGCPSMQLLGGELPNNEKKIDSEFRIATASYKSRANIEEFIHKIWAAYPNSYYVARSNLEMEMLYASCPFLQLGKKNIFDEFIYDMCTSGRAYSFVNVSSWIEYLKTANLSIGTAIHGAVASILAGVPTVVIPLDSRVRELADYHGISSVHYKSLDSNISITKHITNIYEKFDFSSVHKVKQRNFDTFVTFLNRNNLPNIYSKSFKEKNIVPPCDAKTSNIDFTEPLRHLSQVTFEEMRERLENCFGHLNRKNEKLKNEIESLKKQHIS